MRLEVDDGGSRQVPGSSGEFHNSEVLRTLQSGGVTRVPSESPRLLRRLDDPVIQASADCDPRCAPGLP